MSPSSQDTAIRTLTIGPVSRAAFLRYGEVVEVGQAPARVNNGTALRHDVGDVMSNYRAGTDLILSVFEADAGPLPFRVDMLECHPHSAQTIVPMQASRHVVIVCPSRPDGFPDLTGLQAFLFGPDQGVNYNPGSWHHPIVALDRKSLFFVQSWQDNSELDCREIRIDPIVVREAAALF